MKKEKKKTPKKEFMKLFEEYIDVPITDELIFELIDADKDFKNITMEEHMEQVDSAFKDIYKKDKFKAKDATIYMFAFYLGFKIILLNLIESGIIKFEKYKIDDTTNPMFS